MSLTYDPDKYIFGVSRGDTGNYGVGELVEGEVSDVTHDNETDTFMIKGEPVYKVYEIVKSIDGNNYVDMCDVREIV